MNSTQTAPLTQTLRCGLTVLAKQTPYGIMASTYANRTQAHNACERAISAGLNADVIQRGRPFFVAVR